MKALKNRIIIICLLLLIVSNAFSAATNNTDSSYSKTYQKLATILNSNQSITFEEAIFEIENVYYNHQLSKKEFIADINFHSSRILQLANANEKKEMIPYYPITIIYKH